MPIPTTALTTQTFDRPGRRPAIRLAIAAALLSVACEANASSQLTSKSAKAAPGGQSANAGGAKEAGGSQNQHATTVRPFQFRASDEALADLKRRISATKWPNKEPVND